MQETNTVGAVHCHIHRVYTHHACMHITTTTTIMIITTAITTTTTNNNSPHGHLHHRTFASVYHHREISWLHLSTSCTRMLPHDSAMHVGGYVRPSQTNHPQGLLRRLLSKTFAINQVNETLPSDHGGYSNMGTDFELHPLLITHPCKHTLHVHHIAYHLSNTHAICIGASTNQCCDHSAIKQSHYYTHTIHLTSAHTLTPSIVNGSTARLRVIFGPFHTASTQRATRSGTGATGGGERGSMPAKTPWCVDLSVNK